MAPRTSENVNLFDFRGFWGGRQVHENGYKIYGYKKNFTVDFLLKLSYNSPILAHEGRF
jgi:hypothetical protein